MTARRIVLALALVAVLVIAGGYAALTLTGGDAPPPPRAPTGPSVSATGTWRPARGSFVGYRVDEKYLGVGVRTAVGRTARVIGTVTVDGQRIRAADLRADMRSLQSDQARRDQALGDRAIETNRYPQARFTLTRPAPLSGTATGTLRLHGRSAPVSVALRGRRVSAGRLEVVGSTRIEFRRFAIEPPSVAGLVTVNDHGVLEFRLVLAPA